jgi:hypothetical protein
MTTTPATRHQRTAVLQQIDARGGWHGVTGVWEAFTDESDLLQAAQHAWFGIVGRAVEEAIETGKGDVVKDVRRAYWSAVRQHAGLRRLLEEHAQHPAIERCVRREHALLARAAGVADPSEVTRPTWRLAHGASNRTKSSAPIAGTRPWRSLVLLRPV